MSHWNAVTKTLPGTGREVLVVSSPHGRPRIALAAYYPAGELDTSQWDEVNEDWPKDDAGNSVCPFDGWWEEPLMGERIYHLDGVTHWMVKPELPEGAKS